MATGDQNDIVNRLQRLVPPGWFPKGLTPLRDALLTGIGNIFAFVFSLLAYVRLQTRIATATDGFLDMISADFLGGNLPRQANQTDTSYRARIQSSIFLERGTRNGLIKVLTQLTGFVPIVFEPQRPLDTGVYRGPGLGYGVAGGYGSRQYPYQCFVTAFRPGITGVPFVAGYGVPVGAYNTPSQLEYASAALLGGIQDTDIYAAIDGVKVAGTIIWTRILTKGAANTIPGQLTADTGIITADSGSVTADQ